MKILFVSHDATLTGAPILLLHLLKWFKRVSQFDFKVVLANGGELQNEFASLTDVFVSGGLRESIFDRFVKRMLPRVAINRNRRKHSKSLRKFIDAFSPDIIYANTAVSVVFLLRHDFVKKYFILCHLHELEIAIIEFAGKQQFHNAIPFVKSFICPSHSVKHNLLITYNVPEEMIFVVPEPIEISEVVSERSSTLDGLGIPQEAFVVVGSGTADWRKGYDIFVLTASLANKRSDVHFIWVGYIDPLMLVKLKYDLARMGLSKVVHFVGPVLQPKRFFAAADLFFLSSREDPYPLVALEAASVGKPIICFDQAGGMVEFVRTDAGFIVGYMDVLEATNKIIELKNNKQLRSQMGHVAKARVQKESDVSVVGTLITNIIRRNYVANDLAKKN